MLYLCILRLVKVLSVFDAASLYAHFSLPKRQGSQSTQEDRPVIVVGVRARFVLFVARIKRSILFSGGVGKIRFAGFSTTLSVLWYPRFSKFCFFLLIRTGTSLKTAQISVAFGSLCRDRFGVHYHPSLGPPRAVCRVSRVHVQQKQAAGPNSLGTTLSLRREFEPRQEFLRVCVRFFVTPPPPLVFQVLVCLAQT